MADIEHLSEAENERGWTLYVCDECEAVGLSSEPCEGCREPLIGVEVVPADLHLLGEAHERGVQEGLDMRDELRERLAEAVDALREIDTRCRGMYDLSDDAKVLYEIASRALDQLGGR